MRFDWARRLVATACVFLAGLLTLCDSAPAQQAQVTARPPNIVFVLSDDEDTGIHASMTRVKALIEDRGAVFQNFFTTYPLCCPARASILRGQYPHNTLVLGNLPPEGGFLTFRRLGLEQSTVATWLQGAGYRTAFYGKYLNGYTETDAPPPGWDEWHAANNDGYFNYKLNENGKIVALWRGAGGLSHRRDRREGRRPHPALRRRGPPVLPVRRDVRAAQPLQPGAAPQRACSRMRSCRARPRSTRRT